MIILPSANPKGGSSANTGDGRVVRNICSTFDSCLYSVLSWNEVVFCCLFASFLSHCIQNLAVIFVSWGNATTILPFKKQIFKQSPAMRFLSQMVSLWTVPVGCLQDEFYSNCGLLILSSNNFSLQVSFFLGCYMLSICHQWSMWHSTPTERNLCCM